MLVAHKRASFSENFSALPNLFSLADTGLFRDIGSLKLGGAMAGRGGKARKKSEAETQDTMAAVMDELLAYDDFKRTVLPKLQEMVKQGKSADEIFKFAESLAAAKMVTHALTDTDSGRAITATKDILDRAVGKAKERHEHEHKYAKLTDAELDALLESEQAELSDDESLQ